jgi:hypothetical protein
MKGSSQAVTRREHDLQKQAKRVILTDPFGGINTDGNFDVKLDEVSDTLLYMGIAQIGSDLSEPVWQIRKITDTGFGWAESTDDFVHIWDDRATYTYSQ